MGASDSSLAVGFFDGVHLGHQKILRGASAVLTFRNHPLTVLASERAPRLIMTPEARETAIRACGVSDVTVLDFTRELAEMPAGEFVVAFLNKRRGRRFPVLRCGENWRFGKGGEGDADFLRKAGFSVEVVSYAEYKGERISSSRIRACLSRGEIEDANAMMGRRFEVRGQRSEGKGLGRQLGFPTINLRLSASTSNLNLPRGVYEVVLNGERGIANYGVAPTMGDDAWQEPIIEVHLLDLQPSTFNLQPPPQSAVEFVRFIRPERKFDSLDSLRRQIAADCARL